MELKPGMSWSQLQKQEASAPTPVQAPDQSGTTQVQEDPSRQTPQAQAVEGKVNSFRERLKEIRDKLQLPSKVSASQEVLDNSDLADD